MFLGNISMFSWGFNFLRSMVFLEVGFVPFYYKNGEGVVLVRMVL